MTTTHFDYNYKEIKTESFSESPDITHRLVHVFVDKKIIEENKLQIIIDKLLLLEDKHLKHSILCICVTIANDVDLATAKQYKKPIESLMMKTVFPIIDRLMCIERVTCVMYQYPTGIARFMALIIKVMGHKFLPFPSDHANTTQLVANFGSWFLPTVDGFPDSPLEAFSQLSRLKLDNLYDGTNPQGQARICVDRYKQRGIVKDTQVYLDMINEASKSVFTE